MQTFILVAVLWLAVIVVLCSLWSISKENDRVFVWKENVIDELSEQFNVEYRFAKEIVHTAFTTKSLMYKTHELNVKATALRLFWTRADQSRWMPHHFVNRVLPDELYHHHSWGGIIIEA